MKTIEIKIPVCNCGCEGDMVIHLSDGVLDFAICAVCGNKLLPLNKGNRPDAEDIAYQAKCDARDELIDRAFED